ncbi:MAG: prenyltransferase/squalene oxidase repeat-containing protein [Candidatus Brocadiia bacterium]
MAAENPQSARHRLAALFMAALVAGLILLTIGWGRLWSAGQQAPAPPAARPPDADAFLPRRDGQWPVELGRSEQACMLGVFLDSLQALRNGRQPANHEPCADGPGAPLFVTAYWPGQTSVRVRAAEPNLADSMVEAARLVAQRLEGDWPEGRPRVRVDVLREALRFPAGKRLMFAEQVTGVPYGLGIARPDEPVFFLAADCVGWEAADNLGMLRAVCRRAGLEAHQWRRSQVDVYRLQTQGFINDTAGSRRPLPSPRGLVPVGRTSLPNLLRSCRLAADYLVGVQQRDGSFLMFTDPATGLEGGCQSLILEAEAAGALGVFCELRSDTERVEALRVAVAHAMQYTDLDPRRVHLAVTSRAETCHKAGEMEESAQVLEAMCRLRRSSGETEPDPWIRALADFLLFMQDDDGTFSLAYDPESGTRSTPPDGADPLVAQARGALALALAYRELGTARFLRGAQRALDAALAIENASVTPRQARWLVSAALHVTPFLPDERYLTRAREAAASRRQHQLTEQSAPADDLVGGTLDEYPPRSDQTADDLVTFAGAAAMGLEMEANLAAAERAARYLMRLQLLPENSYYLPDPNARTGGFREQPSLNVVKLPTMDSALRGMVLLTRLKLQGSDHD